MTLEIDRLAAADVDDAWGLSTQVGWNQTRADWRRLLELFPETCYAGRVDGELVATSTLATYGDAVGWIGMVLVDEDHRRRGYGSEIFERALEAGRERDLAVVGLDATDAGAEVYGQYGFETVVGIDRWSGTLSAPDGGPEAGDDGAGDRDGAAVREATTLEEIAAVDAAAVEADRRPLLEHLLASDGTTALLRDRDDGIGGYAIVRPGRTRPQVGPIVAGERADATALIAAVAERLDGPVIVDALREERTGELLEAAGLEVQRRLRRMTHGEPRPVLDGDAVVAAAGFEWG